MNVIVMRSPCLMEDEGRHHFVKRFDSRMEAEQWIEKQKDEYFRPSDYYICTENGKQMNKKKRLSNACMEYNHDACQGANCNCGCHTWDHAYEMDGPIDQDQKELLSEM